PPAQMQAQYTNFLKNLAILGGALLLFLTGPGRFSIDRVLSKPHCRSLRSSPPQFLAGKARALRQRLELCPHDRGMDSPVEGALRKTAIRCRQHVLALHDACV